MACEQPLPKEHTRIKRSRRDRFKAAERAKARKQRRSTEPADQRCLVSSALRQPTYADATLDGHRTDRGGLVLDGPAKSLDSSRGTATKPASPSRKTRRQWTVVHPGLPGGIELRRSPRADARGCRVRMPFHREHRACISSLDSAFVLIRERALPDSRLAPAPPGKKLGRPRKGRPIDVATPLGERSARPGRKPSASRVSPYERPLLRTFCERGQKTDVFRAGSPQRSTFRNRGNAVAHELAER
mgnify:CR=1 FL=1